MKIISFALCLSVVAGCGDAPTTPSEVEGPPDYEAQLSGALVRVGDDNYNWLQISGEGDDTCGYVVYLAENARVLRESKGHYYPVELDSLPIGGRLEIWLSNRFIADSCPGKAGGAVVLTRS